jgi:hypothetical protein
VICPGTLTYDISRDFDGADETTDYRLVALPGAEEVPLSGVVDGQAGTGWTAYRQSENGDGLVSYRDSAPEDFVFAPGAGFWVLATDGMARNAEVPIPELDGDDTYTYPLHAGWNIVSNPLNIDLAWSAVQDASGAGQPLWSFAGGSYEQVQTFASAARGGEAFYFYNAEGLDELVLPYAPGESSPLQPASTASSEAPDAQRWTLALTARREAAASEQGDEPASFRATVRAGVAQGAKAGLGPHDEFAPPGRFETVSLGIRPEAESAEMATAYHPPAPSDEAEGQRFRLVLRATPGKDVTIRPGPIPAGQEAMLIREATGAHFSLSGEELVRFAPQRSASRSRSARRASSRRPRGKRPRRSRS